MYIKSKAQSMVEMALIAPVLITVLFITIDAGFWIYGYGTIYNAARRASEKASQMPPYISQLQPMDMSDPCVAGIVGAATDNAMFFLNADNDIRNGRITILYPPRATKPGGAVLPENDPKLRLFGGQIQVTVIGRANFLTPLPSLLGLGKSFTVTATSRRSIESLGIDPSRQDGISCTDD